MAETKTRHRLIPATLAPEHLASYIAKNARERFDHEQQLFYEPHEIDQKSRESCKAGVEILALEKQLSAVKKMIENGVSGDNEEPIIMEFLPSAGIKCLKETRKRLDTDVSRGYDVKVVTCYGIPDTESAEMVFFTADGEEVTDRRRPLSAKEKHDYIGLFMGGTGGASLHIAGVI